MRQRGTGMRTNKKTYEVKLRSIMRSLEEPLRSAKARFFDPATCMEYFERFGTIRKKLKAEYGAEFSDLTDRELPQTSGTTDFEGRGYIKRSSLDQLFDDCRYAVEILESFEETPATTPQTKIPPANIGNEIFISHASKDKSLVTLFVDRILRLGLEVKTDSIFCTSLEGMDIKNGTDFRSQIQDALQTARLIILIVTPNYKASEVCQNEMGATWASGKRVVPLIVEPINYKSVGVLMEPLQIPKISDATAFSKLKDDITQELGITSTKTDMWDTAKAGFLKELPATVAELAFPKNLSEKEITDIITESQKLKNQAALAASKIAELQAKYDALAKEKGIAATDKVNSQFDNRAPLEKFRSLTKEVRKVLSAFNRVTQAIVVCDYFDADYTPPIS